MQIHKSVHQTSIRIRSTRVFRSPGKRFHLKIVNVVVVVAFCKLLVAQLKRIFSVVAPMTVQSTGHFIHCVKSRFSFKIFIDFFATFDCHSAVAFIGAVFLPTEMPIRNERRSTLEILKCISI